MKKKYWCCWTKTKNYQMGYPHSDAHLSFSCVVFHNLERLQKDSMKLKMMNQRNQKDSRRRESGEQIWTVTIHSALQERLPDLHSPLPTELLVSLVEQDH
jgi:hypothetical protein